MTRCLLAIASIAAAALAVTACATAPSALPGAISVRVTEASSIGTSVGPQTGTACTTSVLGLVAWGNSGIKAAAADGGITRIDSTDSSSQKILFIWAKHCTIAYGS